MWNTIMYLTLLLQPAVPLIAYDCGHEKMNQTRISLLNVGNCDIKSPDIVHEEEDIQLLELNEVASIHVYQCKINILQSIYYCGMFSHLSLVPGGLSTFIMDISQSDCMEIHENGTYQLAKTRILEGIKVNTTTRFSEVIAGYVDSKGSCSGTHYTYGINSWDNVIVMQAMEFTITDYYGTVRLEDNEVVLRNNVLCPYLKGKCIDPEYGMSFWVMLPDMSCETLTYTVLYQGTATKIQNLDLTKEEIRTVYTVINGDIVFALDIIKPTSVCRYSGFQTEHPRLVIVRKTTEEYLFKKENINPRNLDLFTYINSKFVYVERHIKSQIETLYIHLQHKRCELERQVLQTQLAVAHHHPAEFALMRMKEPGYTAITRGETIYLIKCQPVEITLRKTDRCFNELPVTYNNQSFYMAPTTHLLQEYGTEIPCSSTLIPAYFLHGLWYGFSPQSHRLDTPESLEPTKDIPWKYEDPHDLIRSGIYSPESADDLRRQIMYPAERQAIANVITNTLTGQSVDQQKLNVLHLFSKEHFGEFSSYLQSTWSFMTGIGSFSSGIIAIWVIFRAVKYIANTIINLKIINTLHGKSWWLLAAVCNTFTTYIVHRHIQRKQARSDVEAAAVVTDSMEESSSVSLSTENVVSNSINLENLHQQTKLYPSLKV